MKKSDIEKNFIDIIVDDGFKADILGR